ncbi:MAG: protein kinase domain-containing protein [Planctomycetota bacterium]
MGFEDRCPGCGKELDVSQRAASANCPYCGVAVDAATIGRTAIVDTGTGVTSRMRVAEAEPPKEFGRYRIEKHVARGGMGVVYKAYDPKLNRTVALKILLGAEHAAEEDIQRFFREAESAAGLQHANIVPIHELDVHNGRHYYTMEYIEGRALDEVIRSDRPAVRPAMQLIEKVARALEYAHGKGVIHRDLKPANIIVDEAGEPRITDFGLAKVLGPEARGRRDLTQSGVAMGTPNYMAPEQAAGHSHEVDARTDVYSLGCVLYELLVGTPPFVGETAMETLNSHVGELPQPPSRRGAKVASDAETICLKCLEKEPERRYASAGELADDIRRFLDGEPVTARRASLLYLMRRRIGRHRALAAVTALALIAVSFTGFYAWARISGERQERDRMVQERRDKAQAAYDLGYKAMHTGVFSDDQREYQLNQAKAHFREALSLEPEHLDALEGMCTACNARWRILESRRRKVPFGGGLENTRKRRDLQRQIFAELAEIKKYANMRDAVKAKLQGKPGPGGGAPGAGNPKPKK